MEVNSIFIKKIKINEVRHLKGLEIPISESAKKHVIITGKNGSGKTSLLDAIRVYLEQIFYNKYNVAQQHATIDEWRKLITLNKSRMEHADDANKLQYSQAISQLEDAISGTENHIKLVTRVQLEINNEYSLFDAIGGGRFLVDVETFVRVNQQDDVRGASNIEFKKIYHPGETISNLFAQFLTNQRMDMLNNREERKLEEYEQAKKWFDNLEQMFKVVFDNPTLMLKYNSDRRIYEIILPDRAPFGFHEMSSGYSAYFKLISELLLRMNILSLGSYNMNGFCFIDEIETHLHIELQRRALPFLTQFFPNIQFFVTTHSPFVVTSIKNAVVYDLENRILISDDPTKFSGETITELYFRTHSISVELQTKLNEFNRLAEIADPTQQDQAKWQELDAYFQSIYVFLDDDIKTSIRASKLKSAMPNG